MFKLACVKADTDIKANLEDFDCQICGIETSPENDGASTINGYWVHDDCVQGSKKNLEYMFSLERSR